MYSLSHAHALISHQRAANDSRKGKRVLILNTQQSRYVKNGNLRSYQTMNVIIARYQVANANKGSIFEMDLVFMGFSAKKHFYPAVLFNPGRDQSSFGGKSGWVSLAWFLFETWPLLWTNLKILGSTAYSRVVFFDLLHKFFIDAHRGEFISIQKWLDGELSHWGTFVLLDWEWVSTLWVMF